MKKYFLFTFLLLRMIILPAQQNRVDSLSTLLKATSNIEQQIALLKQLSDQQNSASDIIRYAQQGIALAKKLNRPVEEEYFLYDLARGYNKNNDYPKMLETSLAGLQLSQQMNDDDKICEFSFVALTSYDMGKEYDKAIGYGMSGLHLAERTKNQVRITQLCNYIANHYIEIGHLDSALIYMRRCNREAEAIRTPNIGFSLYGLGVILEKLHRPDSALYYYKRAVPAFKGSPIYRNANLVDAYTGIAGIYKSEDEPDSALYYASIAYKISKEANQFNSTYKAAGMLASLLDGKNDKESLYYYKIASAAKDSIITSDKTRQMLILSEKEQQRKQELLDSMQNRRNLTYWAFGILIMSFTLILSYRRYKERLVKGKEIERNRLIEKQKAELEIEVEERTAELKQSLKNLKSTQSQLIQSEKMASLGELTAGIAHEIQNPLNFVNNFSEVNYELMLEMKDEINKGNMEDVNAITVSIIENEKKILHHGRRADAIVKGMLQHSKASTGRKDPTDINALVDEYLRLSYQGLRAKDKSFNAALIQDFDPTIGKINIIPQDIGRVLLNLFSNAFYAVAEKKKQQPESYEPCISVSTKRTGDKIEIRVKDNGNGILQKVKDKIFQPFFTTKPTGQGTGLGLSLSYDTIKAHGGELKEESKEGNGAEFVIQIPAVESDS